MNAPDAKTYCMGFWDIPGNRKRSLDHYTGLLDQTLAMVAGRQLVFVHDSPGLIVPLRERSAELGIDLHEQRLPLAELPARVSARAFLERTRAFADAGRDRQRPFGREKAPRKCRFLRASGGDVYGDILSVWLSKVPVMAAVARANPFGSTNFAWIDTSVARFNGRRDRWRFNEVEDCPGRIRHYASASRKHGRRLAVQASYLSGDQTAWRALDHLYGEALTTAESEAYPNDDETLLDACQRAEPHRFHQIDRGPITLWLRKRDLPRKALRAIAKRAGSRS